MKTKSAGMGVTGCPGRLRGGEDPRMNGRVQSPRLMVGLPLSRVPMGGTGQGKAAVLHLGYLEFMVLKGCEPRMRDSASDVGLGPT